MSDYQYEYTGGEATHIPFAMEIVPFTPRRGNGYFSGGPPDYVTSVEGVPVACTVRVILRRSSGKVGDGTVIAQVKSGASGAWIVEGLDANEKYDVICRYEGYNDMIISNVSPKV